MDKQTERSTPETEIAIYRIFDFNWSGAHVANHETVNSNMSWVYSSLFLVNYLMDYISFL